MMTDESQQALTRAFATVALSTIGSDSPIPVLSSLFYGHNFIASMQTLMELQ